MGNLLRGRLDDMKRGGRILLILNLGYLRSASAEWIELAQYIIQKRPFELAAAEVPVFITTIEVGAMKYLLYFLVN